MARIASWFEKSRMKNFGSRSNERSKRRLVFGISVLLGLSVILSACSRSPIKLTEQERVAAANPTAVILPTSTLAPGLSPLTPENIRPGTQFPAFLTPSPVAGSEDAPYASFFGTPIVATSTPTLSTSGSNSSGVTTGEVQSGGGGQSTSGVVTPTPTSEGGNTEKPTSTPTPKLPTFTPTATPTSTPSPTPSPTATPTPLESEDIPPEGGEEPTPTITPTPLPELIFTPTPTFPPLPPIGGGSPIPTPTPTPQGGQPEVGPITPTPTPTRTPFATPTPFPEIVLAEVVDFILDPGNPIVGPGETFAVEIRVEPNQQEITSVQVVLKFNPNHLRAVSAKLNPNSPLATKLLPDNFFDNSQGIVAVSAGPNKELNEAEISDPFIMGTVMFRAQQVLTTTNIVYVEFGTLQTRADVEGAIVTGDLIGSTVTIQIMPTPTPTPIPTSTPTPTQTP